MPEAFNQLFQLSSVAHYFPAQRTFYGIIGSGQTTIQ